MGEIIWRIKLSLVILVTTTRCYLPDMLHFYYPLSVEGNILLFTSIDSSEKNEKMFIKCKKTINGRQKEEQNVNYVLWSSKLSRCKYLLG